MKLCCPLKVVVCSVYSVLKMNEDLSPLMKMSTPKLHIVPLRDIKFFTINLFKLNGKNSVKAEETHA